MPDATDIVLTLDVPASEVIGSAENSDGTLSEVDFHGTISEEGEKVLSQMASRFLEITSANQGLRMTIDQDTGQQFFTGLLNDDTFKNAFSGVVSSGVQSGIDTSEQIGKIVETLEAVLGGANNQLQTAPAAIVAPGITDIEEEVGADGRRRAIKKVRSGNSRMDLASGKEEERAKSILHQYADETKNVKAAIKDLETSAFADDERVKKSLEELKATQSRLDAEKELNKIVEAELVLEQARRDTQMSEIEIAEFRIEKEKEFSDVLQISAERASAAEEQQAREAATSATSQLKSFLGVKKGGSFDKIDTAVSKLLGGEGSTLSGLGLQKFGINPEMLTKGLGLAAVGVGAAKAVYDGINDAFQGYKQAEAKGFQAGLSGFEAVGAGMRTDFEDWSLSQFWGGGMSEQTVKASRRAASKLGYAEGSEDAYGVTRTIGALMTDTGLDDVTSTNLYKILVKAGSFNNRELIEKSNEIRDAVKESGSAVNLETLSQAYTSQAGALQSLGYGSSQADEVASGLTTDIASAVGQSSIMSGDNNFTEFISTNATVTGMHQAARIGEIAEMAEQILVSSNGDINAEGALVLATALYAARQAFGMGPEELAELVNSTKGRGLLEKLGVQMPDSQKGSTGEYDVETEIKQIEAYKSADAVAGTHGYRVFCGQFSAVMGFSPGSPETCAQLIIAALDYLGLISLSQEDLQPVGLYEEKQTMFGGVDLGSAFSASLSMGTGDTQGAISQMGYGSEFGSMGGQESGGRQSNNTNVNISMNVNDRSTSKNDQYMYNANGSNDVYIGSGGNG